MKKLHFLAFWAINGPLDTRELKRQLEEMKKCGFDGAIFHPRYYPGKPAYMSEEYLAILEKVILHAKKLGLEFWIYDENGWPSGSGDGKVLEHFPDSLCQWLEYEDGQVVIRRKKAFNTFLKEETEYFVQLIYEGYRRGLSSEAFAYVTGFFSDEVGFLDGHGVSIDLGGIPWCEEAEWRYRKQYGEEIREQWELLFQDGVSCSAGETSISMDKNNGNGVTEAERVRYRYWQILADILADNFYGVVNAWCKRYGKRYTAHLKGEETLFFQVPCSGSAYRNLMEVNIPAVDALERFPKNHYYPRIASSVSRQFSDGECMAEVLGGSGWGLSPADVETYIDWLAESGINRFAFHLWQYERNSASIRDWPPNIPQGLSWHEAWKTVLDQLRERWDKKVGKQNTILLAAPERAVTAGFRPTDSMCLNEHDGAGTPDTVGGRISENFSRLAEKCYRSGLSFDVTNERLLEEYGQVRDGRLYLGNAVYDQIILGKEGLFEEPDVSVCKSCKTIADACRVCEIAVEADQLQWKYVGCQRNQILLSVNRNTKEDSSAFTAQMKVDKTADLTDLQIRLHERAESLKVCGLEVDLRQNIQKNCSASDSLRFCERGDAYVKRGMFYYPVTDEMKERILESGVMTIEFSLRNKAEESPFVFVEGQFLVKSGRGYLPKDERQWICDGDFYLTGSVETDIIDPCDLISSGFPFCGYPVRVKATRIAGKEGLILGAIGDVHADAARVWADGKDSGFVWGPEWKIPSILPGIHEVELELYPSTFNAYGPHHHYQGDRKLTSPLQYSGVKAFADDKDAPAYTLIPQWHFVKFGIES